MRAASLANYLLESQSSATNALSLRVFCDRDVNDLFFTRSLSWCCCPREHAPSAACVTDCAWDLPSPSPGLAHLQLKLSGDCQRAPELPVAAAAWCARALRSFASLSALALRYSRDSENPLVYSALPMVPPHAKEHFIQAPLRCVGLIEFC